MTKREIQNRINLISFEMIEATGDSYVELQNELEYLQLELEILNSFGLEQTENSDDLNFNVGNIGAYYND